MHWRILLMVWRYRTWQSFPWAKHDFEAATHGRWYHRLIKASIPALPARASVIRRRRRIASQHLHNKPAHDDEVDQVLLAWGSERCYSELLPAHRTLAWPYDHSKITDKRWWLIKHYPDEKNASAAHPRYNGPERLHFLHRRGRRGDGRADCHSPAQRRSGRRDPVHDLR